MPSTEVQRTLVKSPPELWAELSDPASLARHLGELGEIQLTRVEPESAVEWEAENVKGSVQLKASGWGTKVTFSLTREMPERAIAEPEPTAIEPEPAIGEAMHSEAVPEQVAAEPETVAPEAAMREPAVPEPPAPELAEPELAERESTGEPKPPARRGFFARLFRRWRAEPAAELPDPTAEAPEPATEMPGSITDPAEPRVAEPVVEAPKEDLPEASAAAAESPAQAPTIEPHRESQSPTTHKPLAATTENGPDLAAELAAMEQAMVEQDTALLMAVLDRLGAAHHRPFSRG